MLYQMASYEEVSPTQVYEMLHRLRPDRVVRYPLPDGRGGQVTPAPVDIGIVRSLLKEKDYNPIWRDRLAAISYRTLGRIDVKRIYLLGGFGKQLGEKGFDTSKPGEPVATGKTEKELVARFQDMGNSPLDASLQAWQAASDFDRSQGAKQNARHLRVICRMYSSGAIDRLEAVKRAEGVTKDLGEANRLADLCDAERADRDVREAIGGIRKQYLSGEVPEQTAKDWLRMIGVQAARIAQYVATWNMQFRKVDRAATVQQLRDWWREGILTRDEFVKRLENLSYSPEDVTRIVRVAELGELARSTKERQRIIDAQERERRRLAGEAERRRKDRERAEARRLSKFLAGRSDKNIIAWWKEGLITREEVQSTLILREMAEVDVERWLTVNDPEGER
jgi:hypothetical protein